MSSSTVVEQTSPSATTPSSPALRATPDIPPPYHTSTPNFGEFYKNKNHPPLSVVLPSSVPSTPPTYGEPALTPPPRSPVPASGDGGKSQPPDGTSSDKSSETAVAGVSRTPNAALSRKESYKAQRQHYRREKKRAASALLHSIEDPTVVVLSDWLKVRGSLKSWTKLWCVLKPGLLLLYKSSKAKSSHWVGTVLLTSCQVIERPSKKDGFCFKLYHPLEQSIWAPRGPHNEAIGAVVQPLPTAHLIFRAPSQAAGHCWLDGLELALRSSNAMLRCNRSRPETIPSEYAPTNISNEELEKHFNEHVSKLNELPSSSSLTPLMSVADYSPKYTKNLSPSSKIKKSTIPKWAQFIESIEKMSNQNDTSSDSQSPEQKSATDKSFFFLKRENRNEATTSSFRSDDFNPLKLIRKSPTMKCFEMPKLQIPTTDKRDRSVSPSKLFEENIMKFISSIPKRRSSIPSSLNVKRISDLRKSGSKTDSENDDVFVKALPRKRQNCPESSEIICDTRDNILITKTAPSIERFLKSSSSSNDEKNENKGREKFSLINYDNLPSLSYEALKTERRGERFLSQNVYVAGKIVANELAGAASDTDSDASRGVTMPDGVVPDGDLGRRKEDVLATIESNYVEDQDKETGAAGELTEEVAEENKSLLWFLMKQVRPGMDLSRVVLPTFILEPRSFLDKLSDNYYHADILTVAAQQEDPFLRFKTVLRWYLSGLYRKPKGLKKPYNPVLGEAFRCCWKHGNSDTYTYYIAEQVSHHPPISAFYISNRKDGYVIEGSLLARSKFYGNSTSAILEGCAQVILPKYGETYYTTAPYAHCKGIVIGNLSMELGGKIQVSCPVTGYSAEVEFKLRSFLSSADQTNAISGRIKKGKDIVASLDGYWDGRVDIKDKKTGEDMNLLDVAQLKEQRLQRYLMKMDNQQDFESQKLWSKVSEAIMKDDQVLATQEKTVIEEAQRQRAKNQVTPWVPRLFHKEQKTVPEGYLDQGWRYNYINTNPWQPNEELEYEDDFVIRSVCAGGDASIAARSSTTEARRLEAGVSDSDSHCDLARRSKTNRTLKQTLNAIDSALRDQTIAIEKLSKTVDNINQMQQITSNVGQLPVAGHSWDLFLGFVFALVLQAVLNWIFFRKDR